MPYAWVKNLKAAPEQSRAALPSDEPIAELRLWPYRSLPPQGFVTFFGITAALVALPLLTLVGSPVLWGILPFVVGTIAAMWWGLRRNHADAAVIEEFRLGDRVTLSRHGPRDRHAAWEANPHWVRVKLYPSGGPVENYVTLIGAGREVEIGAFLTEPERLRLRAELQETLTRLT